MGGVPVMKYRLEWRLPDQDWTGRVYDAEDGESNISPDQSKLDGLILTSPWLSQASIKI